jgi:predicted O-linked N-acetylglucosamine transferase (SPINDLY family)
MSHKPAKKKRPGKPAPGAAGSARAQEPLARAVALQRAGHFDVAQALYDQILRLQPRHFDALHLSGLIACERNDPQRAVDLISKAIAINSKYAPAHHNLAIAQAELGRFEAAVRSYDAAIAIDPKNAKTHNDRGNALADLGRNEDAAQAYDRAVAIDPDYAEAHYNRGCALAALSQTRTALECYDRAIALKADYAKAWNNRGVALEALGQTEAALPCFERAIAIAPDYADAINNRAFALVALKRLAEAIEGFDGLLALRPDYPFAASARLRTQIAIGDWRDLDARCIDLAARIERGEPVARPFDAVAVFGSPALLRKAAQTWVHARCPPNGALGPLPARTPDDRIRIGYFSPDFRNHALSALTAELFERHDRSRFEIHGFSLGPDDGSEMRRRVAAAFDHFTDVREQSDLDVARFARSLGIDIAVDLAGFTQGARTGIFALRVAPVQASWLGYLGTMAAPYIDYLIADATIVPDALGRNYAEKIVRLPSYQPNDTRRVIADRPFTRGELGLPPTGFVFCSFNDTYKLTPAMFDRWMRILRRAEGSVLFLYADDGRVPENLRREARTRGVAPERLVFGGRLPVADYLARYRVADLFLDTHPYNAGTTASDALWAGLPVLTCTGETFASRVAASLLNAVGLPELVTDSPEAYDNLAVALAASPERIAALRRQLAENRATAPLFDIGLHARTIEDAYTEMHHRAQAGLAPAAIDVSPNPDRAQPAPEGIR